MKTIEIDLTFEVFLESMDKGYSGGGNGEEFTFSSFNGKKLKKPFSISQDLMIAYESYRLTKQILSNTFDKQSFAQNK